MYAAQGPGGIYYSAIEKEPEMHPLIEMGASLAPYIALGAGAKYLSNTTYKDSKEISHYDIFLARTRNVLNKGMGGFFNTFRLAEFGSVLMTGEAMGLDETQGILDPSKSVRSTKFDPSSFNEHTNRVLREVLGQDAYSSISTFTEGGATNFDLTYEIDKGETGRGRLIFQQMKEEFVDVKDSAGNVIKKEKVRSAIPGTERLVSDEVNLMHGIYGADTYDLVLEGDVDTKTNPAVKGVYQNLVSGEEVDFNQVFRSSETGQQSAHMLVPSVSGSVDSLGAVKRRSAVLTAPLSMGIDRFNRLLNATFNQIPVLGRVAERVMDQTGMSLKTPSEAFYKQFMKIGLKATKLSAAYMGLQTVDHYREKFGILGNVVASAGVSAGIAYGYSRLGKDVTRAGVGKVAAVSFLSQIVLPGFNQGVVEGLATTAANIDIGRSYIGKYTGLSYIRRGIEGILPGFTSMETGMFLGLGALALSYSEYPKNFLEKVAKGEKLGFLDKIFQKAHDAAFKKFGNIDGTPIALEKKKDIINKKLVDILYAGKDSSGNYSEEFLKRNPFGEVLSNLGDADANYKEYQKRLEEIFDGKTYSEFDAKQQKALKNFLFNNELLLEKIDPSLDRGQLKLKLLDFENILKNLERSEVYKEYNVNSKMNASLLKRIDYINQKYVGETGIGSTIGRRLEIFGAEMYHGFMGATMSGEVDVDISGVETKRTLQSGEIKNLSYDEIAKNLGASPIVKRVGAVALGVTLLHQMMTGAFFGMMEDPDELKATYSGEKLVEIKKGRWWEAGGTPYSGGETSYLRPHAYASLMSKAKDKAVWGDETEEYSPLTRFFLKNFTYHLEEKNYYDRPYPITGAAFEDVPVIGKLLASTIGRVVKPTKLMHEEELYRNTENGREIAYAKEYGSSIELGQEPPGLPVSPYGMNETLGAIQYQFRELEGLTGYGKNVLQKIFTGREVLGTGSYQMANSNMMDSSVLNYWEKDLGGFGFMSEPIRRLLPRPRAEQETYNPIMNSMPSYLPEKFKKGDPFRLIPNGDVRLPGKGYEAVNPDVKGLDPEDYPLIHKYKILADVAPQSRETMRMREELLEKKVAGVLTSHEENLFANISEYHQKRLGATRDETFHKNAIKIPVLSDVVGGAYAGGTHLLRKFSAGAENLIPGGFRPASKLLGHTRDAIETYETERLYNTANSFWDAPIRDWFRPALYSAAHAMGWDGKPMHVKKREALDEHFDKLQFLKFMKLAEQADNGRDRKRYMGLAARTRTGVNPNGDALSLYLSLPGAEKRFFDAFANATGSDRERILEMVPEDQKHLYESVWSRIDSGEDASLLSSSKPLIDEGYMYQQMMQVQEEMTNMPMPDADWVGWHKDVDINDVKVKYVENLGAEIHDYDMWESQVRRASRRPYLEGSDLFLYKDRGFNRKDMREEFMRGFDHYSSLSGGHTIINTSYDPLDNSRAHISYKDERNSEIMSLMRQAYRG